MVLVCISNLFMIWMPIILNSCHVHVGIASGIFVHVLPVNISPHVQSYANG